MKSRAQDSWSLRRIGHSIVLLAALCFFSAFLRADQVQMKNGDLYFGKVTLTTNSLTLQSENLGTVQLPREKVTSIQLGTNRVNILTNAPAAATNQASEVPASLRKLAGQTNLIHQVQSKFLSDAGPEANAKFMELMTGLTTGQLSVDDLRAEARSATEQIRELKGSLGNEAGSSLDLYLSILDRFLKESPPPGGASVAPPLPKPTPQPAAKP